MAGSVRRRIIVGLALALACAGGTLAWWPLPEVPSSVWATSASAHSEDEHTVYWVGHSLMSSRDPTARPSRNVMESTGDIAESLGLRYRAFDHTLWGSPLSLAYRGSPHAYERNEPEFAARRAELLRHGEQYDALVLVDTVPLDAARRYEHSEYYVAKFRCDHLARRPDQRTYLFEAWTSFQGLSEPEDPSPAATWRWTDAMRAEQQGYTEVAARVSAGAVVPPGAFGRLLRWLPGERVCSARQSVLVIPVATALLALEARLREPDHGLRYRGSALTAADLFQNPYTEWPEDWPRDGLSESEVRMALSRLPLRHPSEPVDDIHPSALGVYFAALVHFATLYGRSPDGAVSIDGLADADARRLQRLAWQVVSSDERSGVR